MYNLHKYIGMPSYRKTYRRHLISSAQSGASRYRGRKSRRGRYGSRFYRAVRSIVPKPEVKKFDVNVSEGSLDIAGTVSNLTEIAQGVAENERVGIRARPAYCTFKLASSNADATGALPQPVLLRFLLVRDMEMDNTAPAVTDVLQFATVNSLYNRDTAGRFQVLWDKTVQYNLGTASGAAAVIHKFHKKYYKFPTTVTPIGWTGVAGNTFQNGHFFWIAVSDIDEIGTFDLEFRLAYYDN